MKKYERLTQIESNDFDDEIWGKKLETRRMLATLAHTLKVFYMDQKIVAPEGVVYWENDVNNDEEFVEIRLTWE